VRYYGLQGQRIDEEKWLRLATDPGVALIASDTLPSGHTVTTAYSGVDTRLWKRGAPQIFQTLVMGPSDHHEQTRCRKNRHYRRSYSTTTEALAGHEQILDRVRLDLTMRRLR
jgi:hypothetical protein